MCGARCACADVARCVVGADVPGGPRPRGRSRWRSRGRSVGAARRGRRALPWGCGVERGRGRRPRRPASPWASPMSSRGQRRAGDVAPYQVRAWRACADVACVCGARCVCADMARCVVGADVPGGPRARGRSRCRSVGAARRGRRALPGARMACVCGAHGVRVRRAVCVCGARCACADMARCVVGADVPGGPRARGRPRCRSVDVPWARRAEDVAPYQVRAWRACVACVCGHGAVRGRGRRPRRPARPWGSRCRSVGNGAPGTSRPTRCAHGVRVRTWRACADMACVCGHGAGRGRGRRPRRPARPWASPMSSRGRPVGKSGWVQCGFVS